MILLARRNLATDVVVANIENRERVAILEPHHFGHRRDHFDLEEAVGVVRGLDAACPRLSGRLRARDGRREPAPRRPPVPRPHLRLSDRLLRDRRAGRPRPRGARPASSPSSPPTPAGSWCRRTAIAARIRAVTGEDFADPRAAAADRGRPAAPAPRARRPAGSAGRIRIGYAGKIAPDWGIRELLDWTETLRAEGLEVELTIVGNKISGPKAAEARRAFRAEMHRRMERGRRRPPRRADPRRRPRQDAGDGLRLVLAARRLRARDPRALDEARGGRGVRLRLHLLPERDQPPAPRRGLSLLRRGPRGPAPPARRAGAGGAGCDRRGHAASGIPSPPWPPGSTRRCAGAEPTGPRRGSASRGTTSSSSTPTSRGSGWTAGR